MTLTNKQRRLACKWKAQGRRITWIAEQLGCSRETVDRWTNPEARVRLNEGKRFAGRRGYLRRRGRPPIPPHVADEWERAMASEQTTNMAVLGDPVPGRSALDRNAFIAQRWLAGASAGLIAKELGVGRGVVAGRIDRMGLPLRGKGRSEVSKRRPDPKPKPFIPSGPLIALMDLTATTCRWPIGHVGEPDFGFCGAQADEGCPYCANHRRIAYRPTPPVRGRVFIPRRDAA